MTVKLFDIVRKHWPEFKEGEINECPFCHKRSFIFILPYGADKIPKLIFGKYICGGCRAHGEIIAFLMNLKLMKYHEALEEIKDLEPAE